jgi:CxxC motif-containing protein (DUF1111 family)
MDMRHVALAWALGSFALTACDRTPATEPLPPDDPRLGGPLPQLSVAQLNQFAAGTALFKKVFTPETGLGPLFNNTGCVKCHTTPVDGGAGVQAAQHGSAFVNGVCNDLTDKGGPVFQTKATAALTDAMGIYQEPLPPEITATARRTTSSIWGSGLLDAVPDSEILAHADPNDRDGDGVFGRPNLTADGRVGRFGRKGQVATLREFVAGAFVMEIGITNSLFPAEQTVAGQPLPPGVDPTPDPELSDEDLDAVDAFVRYLAPPPSTASPELAQDGGALFARIGCATCHIPTLHTGPNPVRALDRRAVPAYTDLLLHDMGQELADICLGLAKPSEFRTEPLWGLRFRFEFLHDGQAGTVARAIELHGGEAAAARERFQGLSPEDRDLLLRFLGSL